MYMCILLEKLQRSQSDLAMLKGDKYRKIQEERYVCARVCVRTCVCVMRAHVNESGHHFGYC